MFARIDRYLLGLFWTAFTAGLLVFLTLFIATDAMSSLVKYKDVAGLVILKYYAFYAPDVIYKMLPIACVVGTVMTLSSLNKGSELVALFASGLSLFRISRVIFISVIIVGGFSYYLSDRLMPAFSKQKNFIYYNDLEKTPSRFQTIKTNKIWYRSKNSIFNIRNNKLKLQNVHLNTIFFIKNGYF